MSIIVVICQPITLMWAALVSYDKTNTIGRKHSHLHVLSERLVLIKRIFDVLNSERCS